MRYAALAAAALFAIAAVTATRAPAGEAVSCAKLVRLHKPLSASCKRRHAPALPAAGTVTATIPIAGPTYARELNGALWVNSLLATLSRVDPATNTVTATVHLRCGGICPYFGAGAGRLWVSDFDNATIYLIDPDAAKIAATVTDGSGDIGPEGIDFADGSAWVANHHAGTIVRIDTQTNRIIATIPVTHAGTGGPQWVAAGAGSIWTTVSNLNAVVRIDPNTNGVVATIPVDGNACGTVAPTDDAVWVVGCSAAVTRIDPHTNEVVAHVKLPGNVSAFDVAVGLGSVWVATDEGLLFRIDPTTNKVVGELKLPGPKAGVTVAFGSVWAITHYGNRLLRITPSSR